MVTEDRAKTDWLSGEENEPYNEDSCSTREELLRRITEYLIILSILHTYRYEYQLGDKDWVSSMKLNYSITSRNERSFIKTSLISVAIVVRYLREFVRCTEPQCAVKSPILFGTC